MLCSYSFIKCSVVCKTSLQYPRFPENQQSSTEKEKQNSFRLKLATDQILFPLTCFLLNPQSKLPLRQRFFSVREELWPDKGPSGETGTLSELLKGSNPHANLGLTYSKGLGKMRWMGIERNFAHGRRWGKRHCNCQKGTGKHENRNSESAECYTGKLLFQSLANHRESPVPEKLSSLQNLVLGCWLR